MDLASQAELPGPEQGEQPVLQARVQGVWGSPLGLTPGEILDTSSPISDLSVFTYSGNGNRETVVLLSPHTAQRPHQEHLTPPLFGYTAALQ